MSSIFQANDTAPDSNQENVVFDEPWHAQVFALAVELHKVGKFTWPEWAEVFSDVIKENPTLPHEGVNEAYYRQWTIALMRVLETQRILTKQDILIRTEDWRQAHLKTPHGQPVLLDNVYCMTVSENEEHSHIHYKDTHAPRRVPIMISPAAKSL